MNWRCLTLAAVVALGLALAACAGAQEDAGVLRQTKDRAAIPQAPERTMAPTIRSERTTNLSPAAHRRIVTELRQELREIYLRIEGASQVCPITQIEQTVEMMLEVRQEADTMVYLWERDRGTDFGARVEELDSADLARMEADLSVLLESAAEALEDMENLCLR